MKNNFLTPVSKIVKINSSSTVMPTGVEASPKLRNGEVILTPLLSNLVNMGKDHAGYYILSVLFLLLAGHTTFGQNTTYEWARRIGGDETSKNVNMGTGNTVDSKSNVFVTGAYQGDIHLGSTKLTAVGGYDIYITKLDESGNFQWAIGAGSSGSDFGYALTVDNQDNVYAVGSFTNSVTLGSTTLTSKGSSDIFVCKLDNATGKVLWAKRMGGSGGDEGMCIRADGSGNIFVSGYYTNSGDFGTVSLTSYGGQDAFIAKLNGNGDVQWAKSVGGTGADGNGNGGVAVNNKGEIFLTGTYSGTATLGTLNLTSSGKDDIYVAKLDQSGNFTWASSLGGPGSEMIGGIATDGSGNVFLAGTADGGAFQTITFGTIKITSFSYDVFVCKLDNSGKFVWAKIMGGVNQDSDGEAIAVDSKGNVYATGYFTGTFNVSTKYILTAANQWDVFVIKMDNAGDVTWAGGMGGRLWEVGEGITVDAKDNIYVSGYFQDSVDFNPGQVVRNLTAKASYDAFVVKFSTFCADFADLVKGSSNNPLCVGDTLKLSAPTGTGYIYDWSGPANFSSKLQNPVIANVSYENSGYYSLTITNSSTGCMDGNTMPVAVNSIPKVTASSNSPVCEGKELSLLASGTGVFQWKGPNGFNSQQHYPPFSKTTLADSGDYTVTVTSDGCSDSATITVVIDPLPVADFSAVVEKNTVTFNNETLFGNSYYWDFGDGENLTSPEEITTHTYTFDNPRFTVMLVAFNDCGSDTVIKQVVMSKTGIQNNHFEGTAITIFPNPFNDHVTLGIKSAQAMTINLEIYDITGKRIFNLMNKEINYGENRIELGGAFREQAPGIYLVRMNNSRGERITEKIIKSR